MTFNSRGADWPPLATPTTPVILGSNFVRKDEIDGLKDEFKSLIDLIIAKKLELYAKIADVNRSLSEIGIKFTIMERIKLSALYWFDFSPGDLNGQVSPMENGQKRLIYSLSLSDKSYKKFNPVDPGRSPEVVDSGDGELNFLKLKPDTEIVLTEYKIFWHNYIFFVFKTTAVNNMIFNLSRGSSKLTAVIKSKKIIMVCNGEEVWSEKLDRFDNCYVMIFYTRTNQVFLSFDGNIGEMKSVRSVIPAFDELRIGGASTGDLLLGEVICVGSHDAEKKSYIKEIYDYLKFKWC